LATVETAHIFAQPSINLYLLMAFGAGNNDCN